MTVSRIDSTSSAGAVAGTQRQPPAITKAGLEEMRDRITKDGGQVPEGLDTLIEKFDDAAGSDGKMTFGEFKAFAKENGVTVPDPPKGGRPPAGGGKPAGGPGGAGGAKSSSSASEDLTSLTDAQLKTRAASGDAKAIKELERRAAAKGESDTSQSTKSPDDPLGQNVDEYA
jgi:hypothetical protein